MAKQGLDFELISFYETRSRKRWPEKSAGRAQVMRVEACQAE
jgi:hypothetical protein